MVSTFNVLSLLGLALTFYAIYVRNKKIENPHYKPLCDISKKISCTKSFMSEDFTILFFPNTIYGLIYYGLCFLFSFSRVNYIFYISIPAMLFTFYLAYISYFKQKNFCAVCTILYLINIYLIIMSYIQEII
jgi:vitamin-K-epoxide reductase (warfarin-sensitive)